MTASNLDSIFAKRPAPLPLGMVVGGSLSHGLVVRLDHRTAVLEHLAVGRYVVIHGTTGRRFFGMVTDIQLEAANPELAKYPPDASDEFLKSVYRGTSAFGVMQVAPMLVLDEGTDEPKPVKTVPAHFTPVLEASESDVAQVFGTEGPGHFHVGSPLDMQDVKIHLDLARFVERSSGVFGKSGTGKTFLTRMLLAGIVQQQVAVTLVFDMHNEYGWKGTDESGGREVKGLRQMFGDRVAVMTLDEESSRRRGSKVDGVVRIGYDKIEPEDVELLGGVLGLSEVQTGALYMFRRMWKSDWVRKLLDDDGLRDDLVEAIESGTIVRGTVGAIQRKLGRFKDFDFLVAHAEEDAVRSILDRMNAGLHVVLEFGRFGSSLEAYLLVANYLTRRIHRAYVERKESALGRQAEEPRPLTIVIEEAHKFLHPAVASHTVFGTIARELRKYNVTLLLVDQRPSAIDEEVMSQIGTRVTCLLDNESDVRAVFSGISGAGPLREVLARLDTRQQALILGHAVPMPVVIRTRDTNTPDFYAAMGVVEGEVALQAKAKKSRQALWGGS